MRNEAENQAAEQSGQGLVCSAETAQIQQQLARILASESFTKSPQLSRFLRFCIERVVLGRQDELKEQVLGVEVFRRSASFDPRVDPIVRVEARRLRSKLEEYYAGDGRFDPLVIYFQRGDYVPRFARASATTEKAGPALTARILIVEDERLVARDLENRLRAHGYTISGSAASGDGAIEAVERLHPDLVLMDIALAGPMRGTEAAKRIWQRWHIPVVYLTAFSDAVVLEDMRGAEPYGYVLKPFEPRQLHAVLQLALSRRAKEKGESEAMREQARTVALLSALENACIEMWEWRVRNASLSWPEAVERARERLLPDADDAPQQFFARIAPEDQERVREAFNRAIREGSRLEVGYRRNTDGSVAFAIAIGVAAADEHGQQVLSGLEIVLSREIERHMPAEAALRRVAESAHAIRNYLQLLEQRKPGRDQVTASVIQEIEREVERLTTLQD